MASAFLWSLIVVFLYMTFLFVVALAKKDNSIVDIGWGPGFIVVAFLTFFWDPGSPARSILITICVLVWGTRLGLHICLRKRGKGEDFRYAAWRRSWGRWFVLRSFFQVFILQGLFLMLVASPILFVNLSSATGLNPLDYAGAAVWLVGFLFETVADLQLSRFKSDPGNAGRIITSGLWKFTRHPNYFGEVTLWWGTFLVALNVPHGWAAVISPLLITVLILFVSGVPMLEKKYAGNPEFEDYARRTSGFFPWFPRRRGKA